MSSYTDVILLATMYDADDRHYGRGTSNLEELNAWLRADYPGSQPQFEETNLHGVFTASINQCQRHELIEKFRSIQWFEPDTTELLFRKESEDSWEKFAVAA